MKLLYIALGILIAFISSPLYSFLVELLDGAKECLLTKLSVQVALYAVEIDEAQSKISGESQAIGFALDPDFEEDEYEEDF